ncbi:hypothetical protein FH972_021140 [Carpinus fangiana]|uniref:Carrier domain-containing protein n=1 Tax=Carpinus fangiana TaxID=176857 RepID=A0A5N6KNG5_9ROSI|nr:hypothetical protein FH972_021140 [Carpinus fangiana]
MYIGESNLKMLSPNGRSRMWDADADGYARGEGVAVVVMKRLADAIADGDHIECIIRETGANQDGSSNGITVPSTEAQATLIRQTYARAGLDPEHDPDDRPQYFEAHGTGTQAGDPKEAAAIYDTFGRHNHAAGSTPLYVGSIKTVIGHLEGAAGLAGFLKASASLQNGYIPPNLSFNRLNPKIEPFYKGLQVPTSLTKWPVLSEGTPRRVSVNSFGFGGANAHAILEQHVPPTSHLPGSLASFVPFVFSAFNEASLVALLEQYSHFLKTHPDVNVSDLSWTLHSRKTQFSSRVAFSASSIQQLSEKIDKKLTDLKQNAGSAIGTRSSGKFASPRVLGVFTGQGAQWPAMGAALIRSSSLVSQIIRSLEESLATLPPADRPIWSLREEMLAGSDTSRLAEAALSQPLCTAIQIVLVDLLQTAGITLASVVGHSSGEIAAAYAAGFLSAQDAIRIAYYRGLYARRAGNEANRQGGAMLAAGLSWEDAQDLVSLETFKGRLNIAAHNSSASVTFAGDFDAILQLKKLLDEQKKFARMLKVDTAYHSHHMLPCGDVYVDALRACGIKTRRDPTTSCKWFSSVRPSGQSMEPGQEIQDEYWRDNMTNAVLFSDAVKNAVSADEQIDVVLEIGPHPALKGPATQNIADVKPDSLPYFGLLNRGNDDVEALSDALGSVWTLLGAKAVDLQSFESAITGAPLSHNLVVDLPSYQWDHRAIHWSESHRSKKIRARKDSPHELLGVLSPESNGRDMRWSNILKMSEIPWMEGHQLQGIVVFPAAGYIAMAVEACQRLTGDKTVKLFELHNLSIPRAIILEGGNDAGVETLVTLTAIDYHSDQTVTADFSIYSGPNNSTGFDHDMELVASGNVNILLGDSVPGALPCNTAATEAYGMSEVDADRVYAMFSKLGYGYTGLFKGLSSTKRKLNHASALVNTYAYSDDESTFYLVHPTMLDVAIQSSMLAYSSPGDEHLWSLHVPTKIGTIRVDPEVCRTLPISGSQVPISTTLDPDSELFSASIDIFNEDGQQGMIQVEDLILKPFAPATATEDRWMYSSTKLDLAVPDLSTLVDSALSSPASTHDAKIAVACERISYFYLRKWKTQIADEEWATCPQPYLLYLRDFINHTVSRATSGQHPTVKKEWGKDSVEVIDALISQYSTNTTIKTIAVVGKNMPAAVRGQIVMQEHMKLNGLPDDAYGNEFELAKYHLILAGTMKQLTHRYPHSKILEIGAGQGTATRPILEAITCRGGALPFYTFTDVSPDVLTKSADSFNMDSDNMNFKVLDIEQDPVIQGYEPHTYDIVIASNALHTTTSLQRTLENTRQLLKPGGHLLLLEVTDSDSIRFTTMMGGLSTWWAGVHDGRRYGPTASPGTWHSALRKAGFGGIDTITPKNDSSCSTLPFSVMAAQAIDEQVSFLRHPLSSPLSLVSIDSLVILGTDSLESARIVEEIVDRIGRFSRQVIVLSSLPTETEALTLDPMSTFINLVDLDTPIFKTMTNDKMNGLKRLFELAKHVLWVTCGAQMGEEPYHAASLAFCRSLSNEVSHISLNALDISSINNTVPKVIAEQLLRQCALDEWNQQQFLWSKEPETFLQDGKLLLPRIMPNLDQNARLNATRRVIKKKVPISTSNFSVISKSVFSPPVLVEEIIPPFEANNDDSTTTIKVLSSNLMALRVIAHTFLFISVGRSPEELPLIALSTTNSRMTKPVAYLPLGNAENVMNPQGVLIAITNELLAASLIQHLPPGSSMLVNCSNKDHLFAATLARRAASKNVRVTFSCTINEGADTQNADLEWIKLSDRAPRHAIRKKLRSVQPTHFLDLATRSDAGPVGDLGPRIAEVLSSSCQTLDTHFLFQCEASLPLSFDRDVLVDRLRDAVAGAKASNPVLPSMQEEQDQERNISLNQIYDKSVRHHPRNIVQWPLVGEVNVDVSPMDGRNLFSKDKTYVLFGLSGQVGQSLCKWMVSNGAGCVCLTSRSAVVDEQWLGSFRGTGAIVKVLKTDVTDRESLDNVLQTIKATCSPIAGVVNGANVLSDGPFSAMSVDNMLQTLAPKIDGSYNLDQAFYKDDLDFFVLFSSISCVIGTAGQSNYVAANGYMNGLAKQRRRRGLAASALDIGLILGIGLAEAAEGDVVESLQKYGIIPLSEPDLRLAFAESIHKGHAYLMDGQISRVDLSAVMTSGLRNITNDEKDIVWYNNPIFSHLVIDTKGADDAENASKNKVTALPVKDQVAMTTTKEEAFQVLTGNLVNNLANLTVLIRNQPECFAAKVLKVDVPVLKLVGGSSLEEICELAMKKLPKELVAHLETGDSAMETATQKPIVSLPTSQTPPSKPQSIGTVGSGSGSEVGKWTSGQQTPPAVLTPTSTMSRTSRSPPRSDKDTELTKLGSTTTGEALARTFNKSTPISVGQSRFWFLRLLVEDPSTFNVTLSFRLAGNVRVGDLERALRVVTARHESLRTCFIGDDLEADQASQKILSHSLVTLERKNIKSLDEAAIECSKLRAHEFDLASGPLLRLILLTLSPTSQYLLFSYHHIIMDMASFQVFTLELDKAYNGQPLGPPPRQYPDYSVSQWQGLERGELSDELKYWQGVFPSGEQPPILSLLPMARSRSRVAISNYAIHQVSTEVDPTLSAQIKKIARSQRSTPFHFYLAAFKAMLFSFTDDQDLTIGIADANRNESDVIGSIGFFLNLLTLRFRRQPQQTFSAAIVEARNTAYAALSNSRLPFDVLLKELNVVRSSSYSPFFQAFFDYRQQASDRQTFCNCNFDLDEMHPGKTAYDISLDVADLGSDTHITLRVQKSLYDLTAANLLLETYKHFVEILAQDVSLTLDKTPLFGDKQLERALQVGRGPSLVSSWPQTLPHRIDQIAMENAGDIALKDGIGHSLTYAAMMKRIEAIAEALLEAGVGPTSRVLVFQQASTDWICSMLAIMRVGGIYVPLDLRNPIPRLAAQAEHCQPNAVLADDTTIKDSSQLNVGIVIDVSHVTSESANTAGVPNNAQAESPAAILYTSGSTGAPKGIIIRHSGLRNEMEGYTKTYKLGAEHVLQQSAFTFDFSVDQIFTGLVNGGMVYVVPWSKRGDPLSITEIMREQSITYTKVTPSEYSMWMEYGGDNLRQATSWRFAFAGGEPLNKNVLKQFASLKLERLRLQNSYGPAEISIASHKGLIDYREESLQRPMEDEGPVVCGISLPNYTTYILDKNLKPLPVGMPGEIVVGGAGVSIGYLTNEELTTRVFVNNPYATPEYTSYGWTQMHRTGDVGSLREDGSLVFRNRVAGDTQVKLRGLRIDLRDVENNIISTAGSVLKEVIVTLRDSDPEYLVAHVVFAPDQYDIGDKTIFLKHLLGRLPIPQYMIPVLAIPLDRLPLTKHSKVDRKAIKALALPQRASQVEDAQDDISEEVTETMVQLKQVWRHVLPETEKLGIAIVPSTSFFLIGADLLNANTLGQMARQIENSSSIDLVDWKQETAPPPIPKLPRDLTSKKETDVKTVLVTGATGNVAKHLLPLLSADPRVGKINCIIRDKSRHGKLFSSRKVDYQIGDLSLPQLGLRSDKFVELAKEVDVVLHLGAMRSFWDNYHMLRATNVHGTRELVALAAIRRVPIHFISSSAILTPEEIGAPGSARPATAKDPPVDGSDGYLASKWASERLLEHSAAMPLAVPSSIYRLLPSSKEGQAQPEHAKRQVLDEIVRCIDITGAMPDTTGWEGRIDLIPAEEFARWLCESALRSTSPHADSTEVNELMAYAEAKRGQESNLERLPLLKWMGRIKAQGFGYILASQEATLGNPEGGPKLTSRR